MVLFQVLAHAFYHITQLALLSILMLLVVWVNSMFFTINLWCIYLPQLKRRSAITLVAVQLANKHFPGRNEPTQIGLEDYNSGKSFNSL